MERRKTNLRYCRMRRKKPSRSPFSERSMLVQTGKIPPHLLRRLVLSHLGSRRDEVEVSAAFGEDASVLNFGDRPIVISTDPITAAGADAGKLAVIVSCNDVAAGAGEPVGVLLTIIMPPGSSSADLQQIMQQADATARQLDVEIIGGHTEVVPHVGEPILSATAIGKGMPGLKHWPITSGSARPGDKLILTKSAGLEGTAILAADLRDVLKQRGIDDDILRQADELGEKVSVIEDAKAAARGGARAMHDVTEGGVLGAVYEMAGASETGAMLQEGDIPVSACTREICAALDLDPLRLISSGALLIAAPSEKAVLKALQQAGIEAGLIGEVTEEQKVVV